MRPLGPLIDKSDHRHQQRWLDRLIAHLMGRRWDVRPRLPIESE